MAKEGRRRHEAAGGARHDRACKRSSTAIAENSVIESKVCVKSLRTYIGFHSSVKRRSVRTLGINHFQRVDTTYCKHTVSVSRSANIIPWPAARVARTVHHQYSLRRGNVCSND